MRETTFGEKAVGLNFNPSNDATVTLFKQSFADVIDVLNVIRSEANDPETQRLASVAITEAQGAQMWAVKAATWGR